MAEDPRRGHRTASSTSLVPSVSPSVPSFPRERTCSCSERKGKEKNGNALGSGGTEGALGTLHAPGAPRAARATVSSSCAEHVVRGAAALPPSPPQHQALTNPSPAVTTLVTPPRRSGCTASRSTFWVHSIGGAGLPIGGAGRSAPRSSAGTVCTQNAGDVRLPMHNLVQTGCARARPQLVSCASPSRAKPSITSARCQLRSASCPPSHYSARLVGPTSLVSAG
jgi:hypothetical protein